jgi:hypothetical protein
VHGCKELENALTGQGVFAFMVDFERTVKDIHHAIEEELPAA